VAQAELRPSEGRNGTVGGARGSWAMMTAGKDAFNGRAAFQAVLPRLGTFTGNTRPA
jgi:hypothetical protein